MATLLSTKTRTYDDQIEQLRRFLVGRGVFIRTGTDFLTLNQHIGRAPNCPRLHEQFDPSGDMDGAVDAFWICGFNEDGDLVHKQASHLLDLRNSSISEHVHKTLPNYNPKAPPVRRTTIRTRPGPKTSKIGGMVAYHGEMWVSDELRDQVLPAILIRLGLYLIMNRWQPNAIFGLMSWNLAFRGFSARIGYNHIEPMTLSWEREDDNSQHQVWAVYMEDEDVEFLAQQPVIELSSHF